MRTYGRNVERGLYRLVGRCTDGAGRDGGSRIHVVAFQDVELSRLGAVALCGAAPGRTSGGWAEVDGAEQATCARCSTAAQRLTEEFGSPAPRGRQ